MAWDRDLDIIHIYDEYRLREQTPVVHAAAIKARGKWIPVAWPPDGMQHDKNSGKIIAALYRAQEVNMLPTHATHPPQPGKKEGSGGYGTEAGVMELLDRMQTGRLKVSSLLTEWFEEFRMYYRKDGLIVKEGDDLMSATRQGSMALRFAVVRQPRATAPDLPGYHQTDITMGVLG
jgi:hypothetical protein